MFNYEEKGNCCNYYYYYYYYYNFTLGVIFIYMFVPRNRKIK